MYAKLVFPSTATTLQKIRDISRLIHESSSGSASLSNLESITIGDSELYPGVNSGWSLATGSIPAQGTAYTTGSSSPDREYIFQSACVDPTKTKYIAITMNANTSTGLQTSSTSGVIIQSILDYGTGTTIRLLGTSNATYDTNFGVGWNGGPIYIFATPRKLIIAGNNINGFFVQMHLEFEEIGQTKYYNLTPQANIFFFTSGNPEGTTNWGPWYNNSGAHTNASSAVYFIKSLYSREIGSAVRLLFYKGRRTAVNQQDTQAYSENNTTTGASFSTGLSDITNGVRSAAQFLIPPLSKYSSITSNGQRIGQQLSENGRILYPLYPLYTAFDRWNTGIISFKHCNVYGSVSDIGNVGDKVRVGNSDYIVFAEASKSSTLVKIE
jgi:hypothetical protein